jgi:hypothetical protein
MVKRKVNKSQIIRDYLEANPSATNVQVARAVTEMGYAVTPTAVFQAKRKGKRGKKRGRPAGKAGSAAGRKPGRPKKSDAAASGFTQQMEIAAQFCKSCGGLDSAISMLNSLKSLAGSL